MRNLYKKSRHLCHGLKSLGFATLAMFGALQSVKAQVGLYNFSQGSGSFNSIVSSGTLLAGSAATTGTTNDTAGWAATIPFNFNFNNINYTSVFVNSNGGVTFGTTTSTSSSVISSSTAYSGAIGVMNRDLWGAFVTSGVTTSGSNIITNVASFKGIEIGKSLNNVNGIPANTTITAFDENAGTITMSAAATASSATAVIRYGTGKILTATEGNAPNREFVIEWIGYNDYATTAAGSNYLNFQLRLAESTNVVSIVYGPNFNISTTARTNEIGLRGASNSDFNNRSASATATWGTTTAGTTNSTSVHRDNVIFPVSGQTFTWTPPTCIVPSGVTVSNLTTATATVNWTAPFSAPSNGYEVYYSTSNTAPTSSTVLNITNSVTSTTTSAPLSGLSSGTTYYVWVRSVCVGTDRSAWTAVSSFTTICTSINAPYFENFDTTAVGSSTNTNAPNCWKYLEPSGWAGYGHVNTYNTSAPNGYYIYTDAATTGGGMLVSPPTANLMNGNNRVRFFANAGGSGYTMEVGTLSDPMDASTFVAIGNPISLTTTFTQYTVNIPSGTNQFLAFRHSGGGVYRSVRFDDINVELVPSCIEPTSIVTSNITSSGATVSWTAPATVPTNGYEYYYATTNTAPTTTTAASGTSSGVSTSVSGLAANTTYYIWIRSVCTTSTKSAWSLMSTFTTACNVYVPSYTNDFSTFPGTCWTLANGGTPSTGPGTGTTNYWVEDGFLNNTTVGAARINLFSSGRAGWLISPVFNLAAGGYQVKFNYGITTYSGTAVSAMGSDDVVNVLMSTDNGATWAIIQTWNTANAPNNTNNTFTYPVASTSNQVKFAIYGSDGTTDDSQDYNFYIDNFTVETAPACAGPTALASSALTATGANVSWMAPANAPANGYDVYVGTTSTAPTASSTPTYPGVTATTQAITGTSGTTYYVWVRSKCSASEDSIWAGPVSFTLLIPAPVNDVCSGAIALTPGATFAQNAITTTNVGATTDGTTSCQTSRGDNVWYTVVVPASGSITIETQSVAGSGLLDTVLSVYSGTCSGTLTSIACDDDSSADGSFSLVSLTGQTPGATLYVSVWRYTGTIGGTSSNGQFKLSAYDATLSTSETVKAKNDIKAYPNPFADVLNISDVSNVKSISVVDISGKLVKTFDKPESTLYLRELNSGMYLVILNMKDGSKQTIKAIKK